MDMDIDTPHHNQVSLHTALCDAVTLPKMKLDLMASVVEIGVPKKSKGTDYVCTLKIIDTSFNDAGLSVNFFAETIDKLPSVKSVGDIICIHRALMQSHKGDVNAVFNKKYSSFALFEGKSSNEINPYQASSKFQIKDGDKELVKKLRLWLNNNQIGAGGKGYMLQMREIKSGNYFDLVCKILHVHECPQDEWILFVWDGTDAPPGSLERSLDMEAQDPLPLQLEPSPLSRDVLCTFPSVGTILRIFTGKFYENLGIKSEGAGRWVKFRNIVCQLRSGLWYIELTESSRVRFLSNEDSTVVHQEKRYTDRLSSSKFRLPFSTFPWSSSVTGINSESPTFSTLMDVLTHSKVTAIFKCLVRVVAIYPFRTEDFCTPDGARIYRIRLTLEDPTARVHAFVYEDDGKYFFDGYPPFAVLTKKINKLLGITECNSKNEEDSPRNPPWVLCCIKSYYLDKSNPWETRRYRVFGTRLDC